jgi:uncharacterized protein YegL
MDFNEEVLAPRQNEVLACVLLLDTSGSMGSRKNPSDPISKLNDGLKRFADDLKEDRRAAASVDLSIITFGGVVDHASDFVQARQFNPPSFDGSGGTPMGEAIEQALFKLRERKDFYKQRGENHFRPWLFLLTDGEPTDDVSGAKRMLQENYDAKGMTFFSVGVGDEVNFDILRDICPKKERRES